MFSSTCQCGDSPGLKLSFSSVVLDSTAEAFEYIMSKTNFLSSDSVLHGRCVSRTANTNRFEPCFSSVFCFSPEGKKLVLNDTSYLVHSGSLSVGLGLSCWVLKLTKQRNRFYFKNIKKVLLMRTVSGNVCVYSNVYRSDLTKITC